MLLQYDVIKVKCLHLISHIPSFAHNNNTSSNITAFISYAWPQDIPERNKLQQQLLRIVDDLNHAGITVLLDIVKLQPGTDVKVFMEREIANCHCVLWIGTPDLKDRIKFKDDGTPSTNVAVEFCHIKNKAATSYSSLSSSSSPLQLSHNFAPPFTVQALHFLGQSSDAFPDRFGDLDTTFHDFTNPRDYYIKLPLLVASIYGIINHSNNNKTPLQSLSSSSASSRFWVAYDKYSKEVQQWEQSFSLIALKTRLQQEKEEAANKQKEAEARLQSLISKIPATYLQDQQDAEHIKTQQLLSSLAEIKHNSLLSDSPHSQSLEYYIPLRGEPQPDSQPADQFEAFDEIVTFLASANTTMILFGSSGAGKSLFARFVEKSLWNSWDGGNNAMQVSGTLGNDNTQGSIRIPIFISLPHYFSSSIITDNTNTTTKHLIELALRNLNFTEGSDILILKSKVQFLFILDGFDEVSLDLLPHNNFLTATHISEWLDVTTSNHKVMVMCRTQQVTIIETKIGMSIQQYLSHTTPIPSSSSSAPAPAPSLLQSFYLMPFNTTQIRLFLEGFSRSPEARLSNPDWTARDYEHHINNIQGLASLVQTPFLLKLVASILPQLASNRSEVIEIFNEK